MLDLKSKHIQQWNIKLQKSHWYNWNLNLCSQSSKPSLSIPCVWWGHNGRKQDIILSWLWWKIFKSLEKRSHQVETSWATLTGPLSSGKRRQNRAKTLISYTCKLWFCFTNILFKSIPMTQLYLAVVCVHFTLLYVSAANADFSSLSWAHSISINDVPCTFLCTLQHHSGES